MMTYLGKRFFYFTLLVVLFVVTASICFGADESAADKDAKLGQLNLDLLKAVSAGDIEQCKKALESGANVNAIDGEHGFTALLWAVGKGHARIVELLIQKGADPNASIPNGPSALQLATQQDKAEIAKMLEAAGAKGAVAQEGPSLEDQLFAAASDGNEALVKELLEKGASPKIKNGEGVTPVALASVQGNVNMVTELIAKGAEVNFPNDEGWTPLALAAEKGHLAVAEALVKAGADVNLNTEGGWSPLSLAKSHNHKALVKFLKSKGGKEAKPKVSSGYSGNSRGGNAEVSLDVDTQAECFSSPAERRPGTWH